MENNLKCLPGTKKNIQNKNIKIPIYKLKDVQCITLLKNILKKGEYDKCLKIC